MRLIAGGTQLRPLSDEILLAALAASKEVYADLNATNPEWKILYDSIVEYRNKAYAWWQISDLSYDSMMVSLRSQL